MMLKEINNLKNSHAARNTKALLVIGNGG